MVKKWLVSTKALAAILLSFNFFMAIPPAQAGFEWTPPPSRQATPTVAAVPAHAVDAERLDSHKGGPAIDPFPLQDLAPLPEAEIKERIIVPAGAPSYQLAAPVSSGTVYEEAVGFGNDIPMVLVMRQIVPPHYSYSFDAGIDPGGRVSWNGGRPWDEVLADAVRPLGLDIVISGNTVWVKKRDSYDDFGEEKIRLSENAAPETILPEILPAPVGSHSAFDPFASSLEPLPLAAFGSAQEEELSPQSYPRRLRPETLVQDNFSGRDTAEDPSYREAATISAAPVPLMKALPPAPVAPDMASAPATAPSAFLSPMTPPVYAAAPPSAAPSPLGSGAARGPIMDPFEIRFWQAEQGASLKDVLTRWAGTANVAMLWNSSYDYVLPAPIRMHGTFPDAVTNVLMSYSAVDPRPLGRLHPNLPDGPSVLVVENFSQATN